MNLDGVGHVNAHSVVLINLRREQLMPMFGNHTASEAKALRNDGSVCPFSQRSAQTPEYMLYLACLSRRSMSVYSIVYPRQCQYLCTRTEGILGSGVRRI